MAIKAESGQFRYGHLSLKIHNVKFDITVPPGKMYAKTYNQKFKMRPFNSVQMSIRYYVLTYCLPKGTVMSKT